MSTSDISEKGLETLIMLHMTGSDGLASLAEGFVAETPDAIAVEDEQIVFSCSVFRVPRTGDDGHGFVKAGGEAFPGELVEPVINAGDNPNIAVPGANCGAFAVGKEVELADKAHNMVLNPIDLTRPNKPEMEGPKTAHEEAVMMRKLYQEMVLKQQLDVKEADKPVQIQSLSRKKQEAPEAVLV